MAKYFVYVLQSQSDKKLYIGCTSRNPKERLVEHNTCMVKSTKNRRPFKLIYSEEFNNGHAAFQREWHLKHPKGYQDKLKILKQYMDP